MDRELAVAEASQRATDGLTEEQIAAMSPLEVMLHAMKLEVANAQWRMAAVLAEKAAPFIHSRLAAEVHRVYTDDSKRSEDAINDELADLRSAAKDAAHDADADKHARASAGAGNGRGSVGET